MIFKYRNIFHLETAIDYPYSGFTDMLHVFTKSPNQKQASLFHSMPVTPT